MFLYGKITGGLQRLDGKTQQNMLNPLSWKLNAQIKTFWNGYFIETKVWIREVEKCWVDARNLEMEIKISSSLKV